MILSGLSALVSEAAASPPLRKVPVSFPYDTRLVWPCPAKGMCTELTRVTSQQKLQWSCSATGVVLPLAGVRFPDGVSFSARAPDTWSWYATQESLGFPGSSYECFEVICSFALKPDWLQLTDEMTHSTKNHVGITSPHLTKQSSSPSGLNCQMRAYQVTWPSDDLTDSGCNLLYESMV